MNELLVTPNYDRLMQLSTMFNEEGKFVMARVFAAFQITPIQVDHILRLSEGTMEHWGYSEENITGRIEPMFEAPAPAPDNTIQLVQ